MSDDAAAGEALRGITWSLVAALTATVLLALAKAGRGDLPLLQVTFIRYLSAVVIIVPLTIWRLGTVPETGQGYGDHLFGRAKWWNALRALLAVTRLTLTFYAVTGMPFANAQAIILTNGLFMVLFAWTLLGERIAPAVLLCGVPVFAGALMVAGPEFDSQRLVPLPAFAALGAAIIWGIESTVIKRTSSLDRHDRIVLAVNVMALLMITPFALWSWQWGTSSNLLLLCLIGPFAVATQLLNMRSFSLAPAHMLAPFRYAPMVFGLLIGIVVFAERPDWPVLFGMALIFAGGLALTWTIGNGWGLRRSAGH